MEHNETAEVLHDPDTWGAIALVIATVSMFGQLASVGFQIHDRPGTVEEELKNESVGIALENMKRAIEDAVRDVERLMRLLQRSNENGPPPIAGQFQFGKTVAKFTPTQFGQYTQLISSISQQCNALSVWSNNLIQNYPMSVKHISHNIMASCGDIFHRINRLHKEDISNEEAIGECLAMLRVFVGILNNIEGARN